MSNSNWQLSKAAYFADFFLVPLYGMIISAIMPDKLGFWTGVALILVGMELWCFTEYWMHRLVFHRLYRRDHWIHHIAPARLIGVAPWISGGALIAFWLFMVQSFGQIGGDIYWGFLTGYFIYIATHAIIHQTNWLPNSDLRRAHELHHSSGEEINFGVSTTLWDRIFGTYRAR